MVEKHALCVHCKATISRYVTDVDLQVWIGNIQRMNEPTYLKWSSEVQTLFALCLQGRIDEINPEDFSTLGFVPNTKSLSVKAPDHSIKRPNVVPKDKVLRDLISLDGTSPAIQKLWAGMMKFKTAVVPRSSREPTRQKMKEHSDSITKPFDGDPKVFDEIEPQIRELTRMLVKHSRLTHDSIEQEYLPMNQHPAKDKAFTAISADGLHVKRSKRTALEAFNMAGVLKLGEIQDIYLEDPDTFCSRVFLGVTAEHCSIDLSEYPRVSNGSTPLCIIGFIPKPGDKERVVAIPSAIMQSLSYPIGRVAKRINSSWKIQGVDSHAKACDDVSDMISAKAGDQLFYSVDMSNFTDRLPYHGLTSVYVDELVNQGILKPVDRLIMNTVCKGKILLDHQVKSYGVGTPMGTFPSFPLASGSNGIVGAIAYANAHLDGDVKKVRLDRLPMKIIGDDIVIWDDKTFQNYKCLMERLGVTVQASKCMQSTYVAEMCSKIITDQGVFQQKRIDSLYAAEDLQSLVDSVSYYGEEVLQYVSPELLPVYDCLKEIPYPKGVAPELSDPYWDTRPYARKIYSSIDIGMSYKREDARVDARDFTIMEDRANLFPASLKFEIPEKIANDPFRCNILIDSLEREVLENLEVLKAPKTKTKVRLECATRIEELHRVLNILTPPGYFEQKELMEDFHIYDKTTIRKSYEDKEAGLRIDRAMKDAIDLNDSLNLQEKEDKDDEGYTSEYLPV